MGRGTLREVRDGSGDRGVDLDGSETNVETRDISGYTRGGLGRVVDPWGDAVRVGGPSGGPERVRRPSGIYETNQWTIREVRDRSQDPRGVPGWVGGPMERFGTGRVPLGRFETGWGGAGRVGGPTGRS